MSSRFLQPNPSLVAIILITKTRSGIHHVFHYPPQPGKDKPHIKIDHENMSENESSTSDEDDSSYSSSEDAKNHRTGDAGLPLNGDDADIDESGSVSPEKTDGNTWGRTMASKEDFLGLPPGLEHFLCPSDLAHKKRFEMSIAGLVFLGWPVFSDESGAWRRKRKRKEKSESVMGPAQSITSKTEHGPLAASRRASEQVSEVLEESTAEGTDAEERSDMAEKNDSLPTERPNSEAEKFPPPEMKKPQSSTEVLNMFHVVFVMKPPALEYHLRVDEMYHHVAKKFSKALKWEQARSDFVLKESERIRELQVKHESHASIIKQCSLARAIAMLYNSISTSRIAKITLTPALTFSLQIPVPTSTSLAPTPTEPQLPGLWLTTAISAPQDDELHTNSSQLASHFALLLLFDLPTILSDIASHSTALTTPLTHYLRATTPTKSFLQISQSSGIPLPDIQFLASHLIYWRRARAVPPLHHRDTYIVSPNADMRRLKSAMAQFAKLFPALPSLPKILSLLSTSPRPYSSLIPSKDHKAVYLEILAWLLRGGWVTQLRTFAWVRVPSHIRNKVGKAIEDEEQNRSAPSHDPALPKSEPITQIDPNTKPAPDPGAPDVSHGLLSAPSSSPGNSSISSVRTAIPFDATADSLPLPAVLILHPTKASGIESRYLVAIAAEMAGRDPLEPKESAREGRRKSEGLRGKSDVPRRKADIRKGSKEEDIVRETTKEQEGKDNEEAVSTKEGKDLKEAWERCLIYFNGEHALEKIAVREGWKRKRVEALRAEWVRRGVLVEARHW